MFPLNCIADSSNGLISSTENDLPVLIWTKSYLVVIFSWLPAFLLKKKNPLLSMRKICRSSKIYLCNGYSQVLFIYLQNSFLLMDIILFLVEVCNCEAHVSFCMSQGLTHYRSFARTNDPKAAWPGVQYLYCSRIYWTMWSTAATQTSFFF